MAKVTFKGKGSLKQAASSDSLAEQLEGIAEPILSAARSDPNKYYVSTLTMHRFYSRGKRGRVTIQVGAEPRIGSRVEAKRGTLQRAVGRAGL